VSVVVSLDAVLAAAGSEFILIKTAGNSFESIQIDARGRLKGNTRTVVEESKKYISSQSLATTFIADLDHGIQHKRNAH
jgi:hypothetical protein